MAIKVTQVDVAGPLRDLEWENRYASARVLVRNGGVPLGYVYVSRSPNIITAQRLEAEIGLQLGVRLPMPAPITPSPLGHHPLITVVICTRDRTESLRRTLDSLRNQTYPSLEILVVDNAPSDDGTKRLSEGCGVRYALEPLPGISWARNRGIAEGDGEVIAYIDDDMVADPEWLTAIARGFTDPNVMAVTGLAVAAELETPAQEIFEIAYGGFGNGFEPRVYRSGVGSRKRLYGLYHDRGYLMAFRNSVFDKTGLFDTALGGGAIAKGGEDIDMLHRVARAGGDIAYVPDAILFHYHRREYAKLVSQFQVTGCGMTALLTKSFICEPDLRLGIIRRIAGYWANGIIRPAVGRLLGTGGLPFRLMAAQALGAMQGPWLYLRSARHVKHLVSVS